MSGFEWEKNTRRVEPYVPGEQPAGDGIIKLNTNENPYPPSPKVEEILKGFDIGSLRKYPDPEAASLTGAIAEYYDVDWKNVFVGVGSDDVLAMSFLTFFNSELPVFFADVTYSFYPVWCSLFGINYHTLPLDEAFGIRAEDYLAPNGGIVIANPNAPTGRSVGLDAIEQIIRSNPSSVCIIDEAYIDFGGESALPLVAKYDNLVVVRTFSKSRSLAGSRIGFAIAGERIISFLNDAKFSFNSYTMDSVTQQIGVASIEDEDYFRDRVSRIIATREAAYDRLCGLSFEIPASDTNFVFASHKVYPAGMIFERLKERGIFVRYFNAPRIDNYLRITIGTDDEMERLYRTLEEIVL